ncbi:MAG TPA: tetratricopeptide repeat protein, partial [Blastocatellia bacterium]|nr:tetratricopeptide repeat protein [Blastocatellia bacterium]
MSGTPRFQLCDYTPIAKRRVRRRSAVLALGFFLASGFLPYSGCRSNTASQKAIALLGEAFKTRRLIEARPSGGFHAAPYDPNPNNVEGIDQDKINRAGDLLAIAIADNSDPRAEGVLACLLLVSGKAAEPKTVDILRRVVQANPASPEAHNDLAVCFLESDRPVEALDELNAALKLSPDVPEALYNRGLCYERLLLYEPAIDDLQRVTEVERDNSWREEASARLDRLRAPPESVKLDAVVDSLERAESGGDEHRLLTIAGQNFEMLRRPALIQWPLEYLKAVSDGNSAQAART